MKILFTFVLSLILLSLKAQFSLDVKIAEINKTSGQLEVCLYEEGSRFMNSSNAKECFWLKVSSKSSFMYF